MKFSVSVCVLCIGYVVAELSSDELKKRIDSINCQESPPSPTHGKWHCHYSVRNTLRRHCRIQCNEGYKASGSEMVCYTDNHWQQVNRSSPPKCEPNEFTTDTIDECLVDNFGCSHTCVNTPGSAHCSCPVGFKLREDNKTCIDINECSKHQLNECSHFCNNTPGSYKCSCPQGYRLTGGTRCIDIDECQSERSNRCSHNCHNTPGSYFCTCPEGYWLVRGTNCEGCPKNSYKVGNEARCLQCPPNSYTNAKGKTTIDDCICHQGFKRDKSWDILCTDIDECLVDNFGCSHACVNTPGSAHCSCPVGFQLKEDNKTCTDIDECSIANGGCEGSCHNSIGSFSCSCPSGYIASEVDIFSCVDMDECSANNGECDQNCVNFPGGHYCSCHKGYRLDNSGTKCTRIVCAPFLYPRYAQVTCKPNGRRNVVTDAEVYPENSVCKVNCRKGFKADVVSSGIKCIDGQWNGTIPQCTASQCPRLASPAHGKVLPMSCTLGGATVKQRCVVTCNPGYQLKGKRVYVCMNNLQWRPFETPICEPVTVTPHITCHQDIIHNLPIGNSSVWLTVPSPVANVEYKILEPEWIRIGELTEFTAGKIDVKFIAFNPTANGTNDTCVTSINIIDSEPPVITGCPDSIDVVTDTDGAMVTWEEPNVSDNVGVHIITKTQEPNTMMMPGKHIAEYIAFDEAGNSARCTFHISITRTTCGDPIGPRNGEAGCLEMFNGKICEPVCDDGYMRHPNDQSGGIYVCTSNGVWKPTNIISDCLEFHPQPPSGCSEFFESRTLNETGEAICMKCLSSWKWSPKTHQCEDLSLTSSKDDWILVRTDDYQNGNSVDNDSDDYDNETNVI